MFGGVHGESKSLMKTRRKKGSKSTRTSKSNSVGSFVKFFWISVGSLVTLCCASVARRVLAHVTVGSLL